MPFLTGMKKQAVIAAAVVLWVPAMAYGINILWKYSTTAGRPAAPPLEWPANLQVQSVKGRPALVMFVHPHCECSRATLGELAIIMAHQQGRLDALVFFYYPASEQGTWARTDLWRSAAAIPGVQVFEDRDGRAAQGFGTFTSGQTLLYDRHGRLLFKGGITAFRGHSGDNAGRAAITALLWEETPRHGSLPVTTPVLGCSLRGE